MIDLGKYAFSILASYGVGVSLLIALIGQSIYKQKAIRTKIRAIEGK